MSAAVICDARNLGAETIIIGEISGIRAQARLLAARFPGLRVEYLRSGVLSFE